MATKDFNGATIVHADLKRLLAYSPMTGDFTWLNRTSNRIKIGDKAGTVARNGYTYIRVNDAMVLAHRLAWFYVYGSWPAEQIDHLNGNRSDNRLDNLRLATQSQNSSNGKLRSTNKSGFRGVSWEKGKQRWVARIVKDGKQHVLGRFLTPEEAHLCYLKAARELHGEFARS